MELAGHGIHGGVLWRTVRCVAWWCACYSVTLIISYVGKKTTVAQKDGCWNTMCFMNISNPCNNLLLKPSMISISICWKPC